MAAPGERSLWRRVLHWGPLTAMGVVAEISVASLLCHLQWWPPLQSLPAAVSLLVFLFWNYMTLSGLLEAAHVGPGYVPLRWRPPSLADEDQLQFCAPCDGFKAPRAHHCRKCSRCVMKMDHHCPWINNCVGFRNQAAFIRFLFFAVVGCIHSLLVLGPSIYRAVFRVWYLFYGTGLEPIVVLRVPEFIAAIFAFGLACGVVLAVGFLLVVQVRAVLRNRSGIEEYIVDKAESRQRDDLFVYPYDVGRRRNWALVLNWSARPVGDGLSWPLVDGCDQFSLTREQLVQKELKRRVARFYVATRAFSGRVLSCWHGPLVCCCQPYTDEPRLPVRPGDKLRVTRAYKYWLYGQLLDDEGELVVESETRPSCCRGWLPRSCAVRLRDVADAVSNGAGGADKKLD